MVCDNRAAILVAIVSMGAQQEAHAPKGGMAESGPIYYPFSLRGVSPLLRWAVVHIYDSVCATLGRAC